MIKIYTTPSCSSCRKAKKWLEEHKLKYEEFNIFVKDLNEQQIKDILSRTENGVSDIISKRSKVIKESNLDIDTMSLSQLVTFIKTNPSVMKRPIIVNDKGFNVGYNEDEIRVFIPRELRDNSCLTCLEDCEQSEGRKRVFQ